MPKVADALRMFAPENWGQIDRFRTLYSTTYSFSQHQKRVLAGVENHYHKAVTLYQLAENLRPALEQDRAELEEHGYTPARNARNLAAIIEGVITELYSTVDCTAKVLHYVYGPSSRGMKASTRRLFSHVDEISGAFPDRLKFMIRSCDWYESLRQIRDELTHSDVGRCSNDRDSGLVRYWHESMRDGERLEPIDDIFEWLGHRLQTINEFTGTVFHELNGTIRGGSVTQMCGMVQGRMLMRMLDVSAPIDFHNGTCLSAHWFDLEDNPRCPFADGCGAYQRPATAEQLKTVYGDGSA